MSTTGEGPTYKYIQLDINANVARVTLNRPPHNVLTVDMREELANAIEGLHEQRQVRAILIQLDQRKSQPVMMLQRPLEQHGDPAPAVPLARPDRGY